MQQKLKNIDNFLIYENIFAEKFNQFYNKKI